MKQDDTKYLQTIHLMSIINPEHVGAYKFLYLDDMSIKEKGAND